jgi:hypothetical protein
MDTNLLENESLLYYRDGVNMAVYKSPPLLHGAVSVPSLHSIELRITDQRVLVRGFVLKGIPVAEFNLLYPGSAASTQSDVLVKPAAFGEDWLGGEYIHLTAQAHEHGPLRSDQIELYLYLEEAERVAKIINVYLEPEPVEWR